MNTCPLPELRRRPRRAQTRFRQRAELPAITAMPPQVTSACTPTHDFLVPNPRPDLTTDAHLLRMLAR